MDFYIELFLPEVKPKFGEDLYDVYKCIQMYTDVYKLYTYMNKCIKPNIATTIPCPHNFTESRQLCIMYFHVHLYKY